MFRREDKAEERALLYEAGSRRDCCWREDGPLSCCAPLLYEDQMSVKIPVDERGRI